MAAIILCPSHMVSTKTLLLTRIYQVVVWSWTVRPRVHKSWRGETRDHMTINYSPVGKSSLDLQIHNVLMLHSLH